MGSGVIYAVIVGLWALVLIPLWLRSHDRADESRSVDRYRSAMSSLTVGNDDESWSAEPGPAQVAASRRRMVLALLGLMLAGSLVMVLAGVLPLWFMVLPSAALVGFAALSWQQSQRLEAAARREASRQLALHEHPARDRSPDRARPKPRSHERTQPRRALVHDDLPEVRRTRDVRDRPEVQAADPERWEAVNSPLPTYVSAPRASRVPRVLDLTHTGEWSGEAMVNEARRVQESDTFSKHYIQDEISSALADDDAFFDQLAAEARGTRPAGFFDQEAPRAVND